MSKQVRMALLIGRGSRVPAILTCVEGIGSAKVVYVLSCIGDGIGTETAREYNVPTGIIRLKDFGKTEKDREMFSREIVHILRTCEADLIIMAGWRIIMPKSFIEEFEVRVVNIHPSILPYYPGKGEEAIRMQWEERAMLCGCTLHFVDEGMDTGPIILQDFVNREDYQTFEEFEKAIHQKEDEVLCEGIRLFCAQQCSED